MHVASLHIYPLKSARAVAVDHGAVEERGFAGDRRWLAVDKAGKFITQRSHAKLAALIASSSGRELVLSAAAAPEITVPVPSGEDRREVEIWGDWVSAACAGAAANAWLSDYLGEELALVYMDAKAERTKSGAWSARRLPISFADGYPFLITTTGSLRALNDDIERHGAAAVPMARFRPNIVIACDEPWREDYWRSLQIGDVKIELVKPCARCVITTKDQTTGGSAGNEPLAGLVRLRRSADPRLKGVLFGWNAAPLGRGEIAAGDEVRVVEDRPEGFLIA